jgi:two-component system, NtrC family, sensor kinase
MTTAGVIEMTILLTARSVVSRVVDDQVQIADTGLGISPEDLRRIFDPFFTTKGPGQGTGLGLAICQRIINAHQGSIEVRSEKGHGTTVLVTRPGRD